MELFPADHHDYIDDGELHELERKNLELEEGWCQQMVTDMRCEVMEVLNRHGALNDELNWAFYDEVLPGPNLLDSAPIISETLLVMYRKAWTEGGDAYCAPVIRIITNERIEAWGEVQWQTQDVKIDEYGKALYFVDAVNLKKQDEDEHYATIFRVDGDGELSILGNAVEGPPVEADVTIQMDDEDEDDISAYPFGRLDEIRDQRHALELGSRLLERIKNLEPNAISDAA